MQPRLKGRAYLVRYADDFVIGFTEDEDARRVMGVLPKRFGKYGLTIHPDKTRLVPFRKPEGDRRSPTTTVRARSTSLGSPISRRIAKGELDSEAEDSGQPVHEGGQDDCPVVPVPSPRPGLGAARGSVPEIARSLCVLRHHGQ